MAQHVVVWQGKFTWVVGFASLVGLVSMTFGVLLSSAPNTDRPILGLGTAVGALLVAHVVLNRIVIGPDQVVILGQGFRREFPSNNVAAANLDLFLTFFISTGEIAVAQFVSCGGLYAPLQRQRAERVLALVQRALHVENIASPDPGTDPPWDKGPPPGAGVVKRSINWPPAWLLAAWTLWLVGIFIYRAM